MTQRCHQISAAAFPHLVLFITFALSFQIGVTEALFFGFLSFHRDGCFVTAQKQYLHCPETLPQLPSHDWSRYNYLSISQVPYAPCGVNLILGCSSYARLTELCKEHVTFRGLLTVAHKDLKLEKGYSRHSGEKDLAWSARGAEHFLDLILILPLLHL